MRNALFAGMVIAGALSIGGSDATLGVSTAAAQSTPRSVCCTQLRGRWEANRRTGEMRCFGVNTSEYYKCVAQKTGR
jgi:hypothetical protein